MNEANTWIKHRIIALQETDTGDMETVLSGFSSRQGIINIDRDGPALAVKYDLREICLADIQSELHSLNIKLKLAFFQGLRYSLIFFMETNQQDNLQQKSGWHKRIQDIYAWHYQHKTDDAGLVQPQLWRKYAEKK